MSINTQEQEELSGALDTLTDVTVDSVDIAQAAKADPDILAALAYPEVFTYCWPPVFRAAWEWLVASIYKVRAQDRLALGLPRGFGKTTLVKVFILYTILFTNRRFILVISNTEGHAKNILADVEGMLNESNIRRIFGDWRRGLEVDTQIKKVFHFRGRQIILAGVGAGGSVRGLNVGNARPDLMIFEDVQKREEADSEEVSTALYKWMIGTAMKSKSPKGCLTLFIGNMYPTDHSILKKLKRNPKWTKFIAGGILEDGSSLWEELQPIEQLLDELEADEAAGHPEIFHAEVLNDENAALNNLIDYDKLPPMLYQDGDIHSGNFVVIDPATDKPNSDEITLSYFEVHEVRPHCMDIDEGRFSPLETIQRAIKMARENNCSVIFVEANAYQYTLKFWADFVMQQIGMVGLEFVPIYSGKNSKNSRILAMFKAYQKGEIFVHPRCQSLVRNQMQSFNPLKRNNTDGILDTLTYATRILTEFAVLIARRTLEGVYEQQANEDEAGKLTEQELSSF